MRCSVSPTHHSSLHPDTRMCECLRVPTVRPRRRRHHWRLHATRLHRHCLEAGLSRSPAESPRPGTGPGPAAATRPAVFSLRAVNARHRRFRVGDRRGLRCNRAWQRHVQPHIDIHCRCPFLLRSQRDLEAPLRERFRHPQKCMLRAPGTTTPNARHQYRTDAGMIRSPIAASCKTAENALAGITFLFDLGLDICR